jgi:ribose-phosphate pyrophosphokinase
LGIGLGQAEVFEFSNENVFVRILENVRQRDVFVMQPVSSPVQKSLMELLIMLDALKRASAGRVTAVVPYYGYARSDKRDEPGVPITARLVADLLTVAGANRLLTVDLHVAQIQGFFNIPVDELTGLYTLSRYFEEKGLDDLVVVAADEGMSKKASKLADKLLASLAVGLKRRMGHNDRVEAQGLMGEVKGKRALIVDDEIATAGTLVAQVAVLESKGAKEIYACCTHPLLSGPAIERLAASPVKEVVVTDTVPVPEEKRIDKITVLSVAPLVGEAIRRIHDGESVEEL